MARATVLLVPGLLVSGVLLAACGAVPPPPALPAPPPRAMSASAAQTPAAAGTRAVEPAQQTAAGAELPRCTTGELAVSVGEGDAAAGSVYRPLVFTNTGARTCELRGFPGVSWVAGDDGHQVGPAADMAGERGGQVPIAPGGTARASLQMANAQNFDPADCAPETTRGLRVYPPGDTAALYVPLEGTACSRTPPSSPLRTGTVTP